MADERTALERALWERIGPPLYYCAECLRGVKVTTVEGREPVIQRRCSHTGQIMAPRKVIAVGEGGMSLTTRVQTGWNQVKASITGRCA